MTTHSTPYLAIKNVSIHISGSQQDHLEQPILPGFYPDPSIVRVGMDYLLVNSTFQYFPSIIISHSNDLITWKQIGHVFGKDNPIDLRQFDDGCGIWAPDISYHDGYFYIFYCLVQLSKDRSVNVRGNYACRSRNILGPYSEPVQLTFEGNDPSHFVDDDGSHYLLYAAGIPNGKGTKIAKLNHDCTQIIDVPHWMNLDIEMRAPEGPHLIKKDGYYYFTLAASGGKYSGHHQLIARSKNLLGPYELSPGRPFLCEEATNAPFGHQGHAKIFQDHHGEYNVVYLCQRRLNGFSPLGRETALSNLNWPAGDWPTAGKAISARSSLASIHDDFDESQLSPDWQIVRNPDQSAMSLSERPGHLRIYASLANLSSKDCRNITLLRETSHQYSAATHVTIPTPGSGEAGLVCYYDSASYISLGFTAEKTGASLKLLICQQSKITIAKMIELDPVNTIQLKIRVNRLSRSFYYSLDGKSWNLVHTIENASFLSDQGTPNWGFTGTMVGLYAISDGNPKRLAADFDWFSYANG